MYQQVETAEGNRPLTDREKTNELIAGLSLTSGQGDQFDRSLGLLLTEMSEFFEVLPAVGFYDDDFDPNAFAIDQLWIPQTKGTIGLGRTLISQHLFLNPVGYSVAAICAHEFAHIYQLFSPYYDAIKKSGYPNSAVELHADYLAGVFLGNLVEQRPDFSFGEVTLAWESMGTSNFSTLRTHGRTDQRILMIESGFDEFLESKQGISNFASVGMRRLQELFS